jgi:hypothetical protein
VTRWFPKCLAEFAALSEDLSTSEVKLIRRAHNMAKMPEQQKCEYKLYREPCQFAGVHPTRADFLAGDIPLSVQREMAWHKALKPSHGRRCWTLKEQRVVVLWWGITSY